MNAIPMPIECLSAIEILVIWGDMDEAQQWGCPGRVYRSVERSECFLIGSAESDGCETFAVIDVQAGGLIEDTHENDRWCVETEWEVLWDRDRDGDGTREIAADLRSFRDALAETVASAFARELDTAITGTYAGA
ncbi:hypothetical protein [Lentisalinibacter salinarum]|uniref:hypothetical protein n=1 Tax=Lentisalinibacter salinarum TaxID=2992239 RepID=UPI0038630EEA